MLTAVRLSGRGRVVRENVGKRATQRFRSGECG